ncbi:flavodoxin family protein [Desulfopila sp. IMCC35008]|uniref:flavodoxin family protein n=1 Tax=Desulfopila sp. IMCC35008 TaxID=2653858 RepID=UPI0013D12289|nr:flavodoxin family protein [Desulfopila sp. IMCC35008]
MKKILAISGSYRDGGITDQIIERFEHAAHKAGIQMEIIALRDVPIEFCTNCRNCTQEPGTTPGKCVLNDNMGDLVQKIEEADGYIFASPTNMYSVTALFRRFLERLVVFGYWPWDMNAPKFRKDGGVRKKAVLVSSCAAPGIMGRIFYDTMKPLKRAAKLVGADSVGSLFVGLISKDKSPVLTEQYNRKIDSLVKKLVA